MGKNRRLYDDAWAPYNFVPMPDRIANGTLHRHNEYTAGRHTGTFRVRLHTVTPLYIRDMLTTAEKLGETDTRHKSSFFSPTAGQPMIPGSSLRGMLRHLTEIVTNSKMHFVTDNKLVFRAIYYRDALVNDYRDLTTDVVRNKEYVYPTKRMRGGYLQRGDSPSGWVIQPAAEHYGESIALVDREQIPRIKQLERDPLSTHELWVQPPLRREWIEGKEGVKLNIAEARGIQMPKGKKPNAQYEAATLLISKTVGRVEGKNSNRHWYPAIYEADPNAEPIPIDQQTWDSYVKDRDLNRGIDNRPIKDEGDVLFYLMDNRSDQLIFFGPTMFFRVPYKHSIGDLIPRPIRRSNAQVDYTEAMFGYVSERDEERDVVAYSGRVSVTSAKITTDSDHQDDLFDEAIVPRILSSPKPTTFQHYLEQPEPAKGREGDEGKLHHYGNDAAQLRGRKLYWRQDLQDLSSVREPDNSKSPETSTQHTRIRPVRAGVTFAFEVHFENLTDAELGALIWVLSLGDEPDAHHQLGMGKPLGLGVCKLEPMLILTDREARYRNLFDEAGQWDTAEREPTADEQKSWVMTFKDAMGDFDAQEHIVQLKAMLRLQQPSSLFSYMQIEGRDANGNKVNQYQGRPVLPYPTEIKAQIAAEEAKREEQRAQQEREQRGERAKAFREQIGAEGLQVGNIVEGRVGFVDDDALWFTPERVYFEQEYSYNLEGLLESQFEYEAMLPYKAGVKEGKKVMGRILEIENGDPITIICEWVD